MGRPTRVRRGVVGWPEAIVGQIGRHSCNMRTRAASPHTPDVTDAEKGACVEKRTARAGESGVRRLGGREQVDGGQMEGGMDTGR